MMTPQQIKQAEERAERDAKELALLLLLLFRTKQGLRNLNGRRFEYDATRARFRVDGRTVSARSIRTYLNRIEDRMARRLLKLTGDLEAGRISLAAWQREFEATIGSTHVLAAALVLGSIKAAANHRAVRMRIDEQIEFADNFAKDVRRKKAGSFARIRARAKSYARAARMTFVNTELELLKALGWARMARNRLAASDHCSDSEAHVDRHGTPQPARPGCPELTARQWIPIEEMPPIGERTCREFCRCFIEYR